MNIDKIIQNILSENISIIASSPLGGRVDITTELLYDYAITKNKKTFLITFEKSSYNLAQLMSKISKLKVDEIFKYLEPGLISSKDNKKIDRDKYIEAIEDIRKCNLYISELDDASIWNWYLDNLLNSLEEEQYDLVIINRLDMILEKSKYNINKMFSKLNEASLKYKTKFVFITGVNQKHDELKLQDIKNYYKLKKYLKNVILVKRINRLELEVINYWNSYEVGKFKIKEVN